MRIAYLLTTADSSGGTERTIITQANGVARQAACAAEIISVYRTAKRPHFAIDRRVSVRYALDRPADHVPSTVISQVWDDQYDARAEEPLERLIRRSRADILVTTTPALALLAVRHARPGVRIIHQEHRYSKARGEGLEPLRMAAPKLWKIVVLTERNADYLREDPAFDGCAIEVVENAVDVAVVPRSPLSQPLIVSAGRFVPAKQFEHLIRAFGTVAHDHPDWRLRIYGDGPSRGSLQTVIRRQHLESRVELPGTVKDLAGQLAKASIFAQSSRSEALPMVLLEAQAAGIPVVAYDTHTGPRDILERTGGGLVVPQNSIEGLAAGLGRLMTDAGLRTHLGELGRSGAWEYHTDRIIARWIRVFTERPSLRPAGQNVEDPVLSERSAVATVSADRILAAVTAALRSSTVPFRPATPSRAGIWRLAAGREDAGRIIEALSQGTPDLVAVARRRGQDLCDEWRLGENPPLLADAADELLLYDSKGVETGSLQLWSRTHDGLRHRPSKDDGPDVVDHETWATWLASGTPTATGLPYWDDPQFDIDVVYTWVDGDDPAWRARRAPFLGQADTSSDAARSARFRNRDEIYYSVRSVRRYMPWVRRIFIVTDRQVPVRVMAEFPEITIIDHREIFPQPSVLPVFNSHAIEACLHRIPGLAEHFLYFNDDVLVARPLRPETFFFSNGIAKFFPHGVPIDFGDHDDKPHLQAASNNRRLLATHAGMEITRSLLHTPYAQRKSNLAELETRFPEVFETTRASRFRSPTDFSIPSSLAPYYGYARGLYVPASIGYRYMSLRSDALAARFQNLLDDPRAEIVAIAEPTAQDRRHRDENVLLTAFLEELVSRGSVPHAVPTTTTSTVVVNPATAASSADARTVSRGAD